MFNSGKHVLPEKEKTFFLFLSLFNYSCPNFSPIALSLGLPPDSYYSKYIWKSK